MPSKIINIGNVTRPAGYFKFKTKEVPGRAESAVIDGPGFAMSTTGNVYYISNTGVATNTGKSIASPWPFSKLEKSLALFTYGDTILFEKGSVYYGPVNIGGYFSGSSTGKTITYSSYGTGAKPIITTLQAVPGAYVAGNWSQVQGFAMVWKMTMQPVNYVPYTPRFLLDGYEYTRAKSIEDISAAKRIYWDKDLQTIYLYSEGNPTGFYSSIESANFTKTVFNVDGQGRVEIRGLDIRGGYGACIDIAYTGGIIEECNIGLNSNREGVRINGVNGLIIRNNSFDTGINSVGDFYLNGEGGDAIIVGQNPTNNIEIYNNTFSGWVHGCLWIEQIKKADGTSDTLTNINFHHNYCSGSNLVYGRGIGCYGFTTGNIRVEYNTFEDFPVQSQIGCHGLYFRYNLINGVRNTVLDDAHAHGVAYALNVWHNKYLPQNMNISYNTFKNCEQAAIEIGTPFGDGSLDKPIKNNVFEENTFEHNGFAAINPSYSPNLTPLNLDIIMRDSLAVENNTFKNNKFVRATNDKSIYYGKDINNNYLKTVAEFNAQNGNAGDIITGNTVTT